MEVGWFVGLWGGGGGVAVKGGGCEERQRDRETENGGRVTLVVTLG